VAYHNKSNENQLTGSTTERGEHIQKQHSNTVSLLSSAEKKPGSKRKFCYLVLHGKKLFCYRHAGDKERSYSSCSFLTLTLERGGVSGQSCPGHALPQGKGPLVPFG
jgi:hypothetical protein